MRERNSHLLYRGPAKGIPTQTWRARLTDMLSVSWEPLCYAACIIIVLLDVFIWRP